MRRCFEVLTISSGRPGFGAFCFRRLFISTGGRIGQSEYDIDIPRSCIVSIRVSKIVRLSFMTSHSANIERQGRYILGVATLASCLASSCQNMMLSFPIWSLPNVLMDIGFHPTSRVNSFPFCSVLNDIHDGSRLSLLCVSSKLMRRMLEKQWRVGLFLMYDVHLPRFSCASTCRCASLF
jgi:hypothetical protein